MPSTHHLMHLPPQWFHHHLCQNSYTAPPPKFLIIVTGTILPASEDTLQKPLQFLTPGTRDCKAPAQHRVNAFSLGRLCSARVGYTPLVSGGNEGHVATLWQVGGWEGIVEKIKDQRCRSCRETERELTRTSEFTRYISVHNIISHLGHGGLMWRGQFKSWHHRELAPQGEGTLQRPLL